MLYSNNLKMHFMPVYTSQVSKNMRKLVILHDHVVIALVVDTFTEVRRTAAVDQFDFVQNIYHFLVAFFHFFGINSLHVFSVII